MQKIQSVFEKSPFVDLVKDSDNVFIEEIPSRTKARHFFVSVDRLPETKNTKNEKSGEDLLENAALLLQNREYLLARHLYSAALKLNLKDAEALRGLGICLLRLGDPAAARKCFRALWDLFSEPKAAFWLAQCFSSEKDDLLALEWFRKLKMPQLLNKADRFEYYKELGNCLSRLGDFPEAEKTYRAALEIEPTSDVIAANLGTLEIQRGHLQSAVSNFERALRHNPENGKAFAGMGIVAFQSQDFALAARFFGKALDIDSQNLVALHQLIECNEQIDLYKETAFRMERFLEKEPQNHRIRFALAALLYQKGAWKECESQIDTILSTEPGYLNARKLKEELLYSRKKV